MPIFWQFSGQNNIAKFLKGQRYDVPVLKRNRKNTTYVWLEELSENFRITSEENDVSLTTKVKGYTMWKL